MFSIWRATSMFPSLNQFVAPISLIGPTLRSPILQLSRRVSVSSTCSSRFLSHWQNTMGGKDVSSSQHLQKPMNISYLTQQEATEIDEFLMGPAGFSVDQLMELAGLSVAASVAEVYRTSQHIRVLVICGPGNNGGDGLVAARHLHHFGYKLSVCYPKRVPKPLFINLVTQLGYLSIPLLSVEELPVDLSNDFDILIDAIFGFSFHGKPRPPFDRIIQKLISIKMPCHPAVVSVDIPSGWHVEDGDVDGDGLKPDMLVSLTAPKLCAKKFCGPHHFLGGRFVPPSVAEKFKLQLPPYPGASLCVRIGQPPSVDVSSLRENYVSPAFLEDQVDANPIIQFQKWFSEALAAGLKEPNAMVLSTASKDGKPSSRMVLLKGFDEHGFVWYTNYESRKSHEIDENPYATLLFYWDCLNRQVRVEGMVEKNSDTESDKYFHSRPRGSQISTMSTVSPSRDALHHEFRKLESAVSDRGSIPRPEYWGGYKLLPRVIEFWQGQPSRLHDRLQYTLQEIDGSKIWNVVRLFP